VRELIAAGLVDVAIPVPIAHHPEAAVRRATKKLSAGLRSRLTTALDELESARDAIVSAPQLAAAIGTVEAVFTSHALTEAKRHEGRTYAGRSILYEETRRDTTVALGEELRRKLDAPVTVMLELARLYTSQIAASLSQSMLREFNRAKTKSVPLVDFWLSTAKHFEAEPPPAVLKARQSLQALVAKSVGRSMRRPARSVGRRRC
jgi:acyl transferase domain-containing protein